ncbi:hypothetical protein EXIGLDRAFT_737496 [Exidia glandulosa HHB12029]|uniref:Protein kinase domain-containing protein n=1 Tax=Exidia glandulosa HHB12029 TaxID=1314781 RepID=A0A165IY53_EXIGL|nr:hypothetical protein EXIGLDRAFT_737496 [Exidia glandulosa HHB12029]
MKRSNNPSPSSTAKRQRSESALARPRTCLSFAPGESTVPSLFKSDRPPSNLLELAALGLGSSRKPSKAYRIPPNFDTDACDWSNWEQAVEHFTELNLDSDIDDEEGIILFLQGAASGSSSSTLAIRKSRTLAWAMQTPSAAAMNSDFQVPQSAVDSTTIFDGRPLECTGPDVCCYVPAFYAFKKAVNETDISIPDDDENIVHALRLMEAGCAYYDDEALRQLALAKYLVPLCRPVFWCQSFFSDQDVDKKEICPDASCLVHSVDTQVAARSFPFLGEFKNEIGEGDSDPEYQAACDYHLFCQWKTTAVWRERSCVPSILMGLVGKDIVINGAIYMNGPIVQRLYRTELQVHGSDRLAAAKRLVHVFASLTTAVSTLRDFYHSLPSDPIPPYVEPTYTIEGWALTWEGSPIPSHPRSERMVFYATAKSSTNVAVSAVVKFSQTYSVDAHRKMEELGAAAPLLHHHFDDVIGRHVVLTKRLDPAEEPLDQGAVQRLRGALEGYHRAGFVFGDLRAPNIVRDNGALKLVDFDWAGHKGKVRYPKINTQLDWAKGVASYALILAEHDLAMLDKLSPPPA